MAQDGRAILMGHGSSQFNLAAVRSRAEELRRSVQEVVEALGSGATLHWEDFLKKFSVINQQVMGLREQLRGILKQVTVHPKLVDSPDVAHALPIQLASRLTPEMEARDAELLASMEEAAGGGTTPLPGGPGAAGMQRYEQVSSQLDDFNRFLVSLTSAGGPLDPKGPARKEIQKASQTINSLVADAKAVALAGFGATPPAGGIGAAAAAGLAGAPRVGQQAVKRARTSGPAGGAAAPEAGLEPALLMLLTGEGLRPAAPIRG